MSFPSTPSELVALASEARAREVFDDFDQFSDAMQEQAQLLAKLGMHGNLSDFTFRELVYLMMVFWRDCNQARFHAIHEDEDGKFTQLIRAAQVDQFVNGWINALTSVHQLSDDPFQVAEPDGS